MTIKGLKYVKINSASPSYLIFSKVNEYFEEIYKSKYLTLVPADESKKKIKKYEEQWSKIRDLTKSITKNSDNYFEKYMKIKFNTDDELPLKKTIEIPGMIIIVRTIFLENNKNYPQVFSRECLYKLWTHTRMWKLCCMTKLSCTTKKQKYNL